jgi:hypothetical protein
VSSNKYKPERRKPAFKAGDLAFARVRFVNGETEVNPGEPLIVYASLGYFDRGGDEPWYYCFFPSGSGGHLTENFMKGSS